MSPLEFEVKLFDTTSLAADGSNIPRRSCEAYLASPDYQTIIRDKVAIGGLSHKDRRLKPELKGIIGMDDQVLIHDNALFYITKLYFKTGDNFLYAQAKTFDPEIFSGNRRDNITNLIGLLESGVRLPVSVVIQALWSKRGVAEKIIRIKGFDFTQNPSFKGAGDIKIFSEVISESIEYEKSFSEQDLELATREYSIEGEISLCESNISFSEILEANPDKDIFSYKDIVRFYGQGSDQEKLLRPDQRKGFHRLDLSNQDDDNQDPDWNLLKKYVDEGDQQALAVIYRGNKDSLISILKSVPEDEPNRDELIKARLNQFFRVTPNVNKSYSTDMNTVADRVRTDNQPRFTKYALTLKSYKKYLASKPNITDDQLHKCKLLFIQDMNKLVKDVASEIYKGKTLATLYALNQYGKEVSDAAIQFSKTYRKLMISEKILKFPPKGLYGEWLMDARSYYQALLKYVVGTGLPDLEFNLIKL